MKNNASALILLSVVIIVSCTSAPPTQISSPVQQAPGTADFPWVRVPMRTAAQKAKGYAGGEMGQMAQSIAICAADPSCLAVSIDTAAVYLSTDGGRSWKPKRSGIMSNGVQSVAFDPASPYILWAAGMRGSDNPADYRDPVADGIYRSIDGGESWALLHNAGFLTKNINKAQNEFFAFDPDSFDGTQHRTVYAATHGDGLLVTTDAGSTWRSLGLADTIINAVVLHPMDHRLLFVAADTGLFRSDDAGETFARIGGNLPASAPILGITVNAKDPEVLYVAAGTGGIWRSGDGGRSFQKRMNGILDWDATACWACICSSPVNPLRLYADANWAGGERFPCWSDDGGASWHHVQSRERCFSDNPSSAEHYWVEPIVAHPSDPNIAFQVLMSVRKTTDGGRNWTYSSDGISGFRRLGRTSIAFRPDDPKKMVFFHLDYGTTLTTDGGDTFSYCPPPRQYQIKGWTSAFTMNVGAYDPTPGSRKLIGVVGSWNEQVICTTEDDCRTWQVQKDSVGYYVFLAFHPQKPNIVYAGRVNDSLRSRDGGRTWTTLQYPIKAMLAGNGDVVFAAVQKDARGWEWQVLRSSDQGDTWTPLPGRISGALGEVDVDPGDPNRLYAAGDAGVWIFDGAGWTVRDDRNGLERNFFGDLCFRWIAVDPTRPQTIYAGQMEVWHGIARGIFRSTDSGEHWDNISANLGPDLTVWAITVSPHDGTVWLGTDYGNWMLPP